MSQLAGNALKEFQLSTDPETKSDPEFGKKVGLYILSTINANNSYFWLRNGRFRANRNLSYGVVNMTKFQDLLDMNGKFNYVNINWKSIMIVNTIVSRLVGRWMGRIEKINVTAIDPFSQRKKKENEDEAEYVLDNKEMLGTLESESGVPMIPKDQFVPEDKDELDAWKTEFNRLPEEIQYEMGVNNIFEMNGWFSTLKEMSLHDSAEVGLVGTYTWMDEDGIVHVDYVKPENAIYGYSVYNDFRDSAWRGEVVSIKISDLRYQYGQENGGILTEQEIFEIAQSSKEYNLSDKITWIVDWTAALLRPYDEWNVDVVKFELKTLDKEMHLVTTTKQNKSTIIRKVDRIEKISENQELIKKDKYNIYEGAFVRTTGKMLKWGLKKNMIRPQDPREVGDVEFSYSFYMYQNNNMRNVAIPEKIEEPTDQMILARLKIQQLVANMIPAGAAINVDAMQELDLGLGDSTSILDVQKIYEQTGKLYYRGRDAEGNQIPVPIQELQNSGFISQLQGLIQIYQFHQQVLRDESGINEFAEGQSVKPRTAVGAIQAQTEVSYNATDYIYDAFLRLMEDTARKVGCLLNKSISFGSDAYRNLMKEDQVKGRNFTTKIKMAPTDDEIAQLQMMMNTALQSNQELIAYIDPFKILRIAKEDVKLAELYFRQAQKRYIKSTQQIAQQNSQMNMQGQMQSAQMKGQMDTQLKQLEKELEIQKQEAQSKGQKENTLLSGIMAMYQESQKTGAPIPAELAPLASEVLKNIALPLMIENEEAKQEIIANMQQSQQPNPNMESNTSTEQAPDMEIPEGEEAVAMEQPQPQPQLQQTA